MNEPNSSLLYAVNRAIIRLRGIYAEWSGRHGISYNEMLVLYTIRENGFCTQKQICSDYLLPRQTINQVIAQMRRQGLLELRNSSGGGREKAFVLTEKGKIWSAPLLASLTQVESRAVELMGEEQLEHLTALLRWHDSTLCRALGESEEAE